MSAKYDRFIEIALRRARPEFSFITPYYAPDLPGELTLVLVRALILEKGLTAKAAAQVVLNFCERRGSEIPRIINQLSQSEPLDFSQ